MNYLFYSKARTNGKKHSISIVAVEDNEFDKVIVIKEILTGLLVVQYKGMDGYLITSKKFYESRESILKNEAIFLALCTFLIDSKLTMENLFFLTNYSYSDLFFSTPEFWSYYNLNYNKSTPIKIYLFVKNTISFLFFLGKIKYLKKILEN